MQKNVCIINIEGRGLLGTRGIDARVFTALNQQNINIGVISQGSSERGLGFVIAKEEAEKKEMENTTEMEETPAAARIQIQQEEEGNGEAEDEYKKVDGEM